MTAYVHEVGALRRVSKALVDGARVRAELTYHPPRRYDGTLPEPVENWGEDGDCYLLPRNYPVPWVALPPLIGAASVTGGVAGPGPTSLVTLRDVVQERAVVALTETEEDRVVSVAAGRGKSVIALHALATTRRWPALVVVPTEALAQQWVERAQQHLRGVRIGWIQGPKWDYEDKHLTVGILNTVALGAGPPGVEHYFRTVVFDELQRCGAPTLGRACSRFVGQRWGLSATPFREDGAEALVLPHLGPVVFQDRTQDLVPRVTFVETGLVVHESSYFWGGKVLAARLLNKLCAHPGRNALVASWIVRAARAGRTCLVLGERIEQLKVLGDLLAAEGVGSGLFVGAQKGEAPADVRARRAAALEQPVTLATAALAKEGLDRPAFDTVFVLVSFGSQARAEQSAGRALRKDPGKKDPVVVVFVDDGRGAGGQSSYLRRLASKMHAAFAALGYPTGRVGPKSDAPALVPIGKPPRRLGTEVRGGR